MIAFADKTMIPALKTIWKDCFQDDGSYADLIFKDLLLPENILVSLAEDGFPQAMLCIEYMDIVCANSRVLSGAYVFGVATAPAAQGKGLSTRLLEQMHILLADRGVDGSVLVPASDSLFAFYEKREYEFFSGIKKVRITSQQISTKSGQGAVVMRGLEQLERLRNKQFSDCALNVKWNARYLGYISKECRHLDGKILRYTGGGEDGFAVCYRDGHGGVLIKEMVISSAFEEDFFQMIHQIFGAEYYIVYFREDRETKFTNSVLPFSMVRWYDKEKKRQAFGQIGAPNYIAHVLD